MFLPSLMFVSIASKEGGGVVNLGDGRGGGIGRRLYPGRLLSRRWADDGERWWPTVAAAHAAAQLSLS